MKLTGVKKAVSAYNNAYEFARIYANVKTGELTCIEYESCNSWSDLGFNWVQVTAGHSPRSMWNSAKLTMIELREKADDAISREIADRKYYEQLEKEYQKSIGN